MMSNHSGAQHITGSEQFEKEVLQSKEPVVLDFYAEWCGPCKLAEPIINDLAEEFSGKVKVLKLDVDEEGNREITQQFGVMSIPTVISFKAGKPTEKKIGFIGEDGYRGMVTKALTA
jgi:thioredoxin 1